VLELQYAREALDILAKAHLHQAVLQASHLSQALLRIAKAVVWDSETRRKVVADQRLASLVSAVLARPGQ
jgi:hypothetical protein